VVPIVYGFPASRLAKEAEKRRIVLGGYSVSEGDPTQTCLDCDHHWGHTTLRWRRRDKYRGPVRPL